MSRGLQRTTIAREHGTLRHVYMLINVNLNFFWCLYMLTTIDLDGFTEKWLCNTRDCRWLVSYMYACCSDSDWVDWRDAESQALDRSSRTRKGSRNRNRNRMWSKQGTNWTGPWLLLLLYKQEEDESAMQAKPRYLPSLLLWRRQKRASLSRTYSPPPHGIKPELCPGIWLSFACVYAPR
jgi:hypothetical protein